MKWDHTQSTKEVIRHMLFTFGMSSLLYKVRNMRGRRTVYVNRENREDVFNEIYRVGAWVHSDGQCSFSGVGSESPAELSTSLPSLLARLQCRRLLDVGCGDWNWMRNIELPCEYVGVDVVPEVIEANRRYERPGVTFSIADAVSDQLPTADVALCREVLFHLSFEEGLAALANIKRSARWLVATTDPTIWFNSNIRTGDFRKVNLQRAPYRLPAPREAISDSAVSEGRILGVWATQDI